MVLLFHLKGSTMILTGHDLVIQRRASFDRTRFRSGLNLENLIIDRFVRVRQSLRTSFSKKEKSTGN